MMTTTESKRVRKCHRPRNILTTGQVAKVCKVSVRTICNWMESGLLKGWRLPGSDDRRFLLSEVVSTMKKHQMDLGDLEQFSSPKCLIYGHVPDRLKEKLAPLFEEILCSECPFESGFLMAEKEPLLMLVGDAVGLAVTKAFARSVRKDSKKDYRVLAALLPEGESEVGPYIQSGYQFVYLFPHNHDEIIKEISTAMKNVVFR